MNTKVISLDQIKASELKDKIQELAIEYGLKLTPAVVKGLVEKAKRLQAFIGKTSQPIATLNDIVKAEVDKKLIKNELVSLKQHVSKSYTEADQLYRSMGGKQGFFLLQADNPKRYNDSLRIFLSTYALETGLKYSSQCSVVDLYKLSEEFFTKLADSYSSIIDRLSADDSGKVVKAQVYILSRPDKKTFVIKDVSLTGLILLSDNREYDTEELMLTSTK